MNWLSIEHEQPSSIPAWVTPDNHHLTLVKIGYVHPDELVFIPGWNGEHGLFDEWEGGRMKPAEWAAFSSDIAANGNKEPILLVADLRGFYVYEGNHRIRAAAAAGRAVYTELRCFAGVPEPQQFKPEYGG